MLKRRLPFLAVSLFLGALIAGCSGGVPVGNASVRGTVVDATTGDPIAQAAVCMLYNGQEARCTQSDSDGAYAMERLPAGLQTFRVRAEGHVTYEQQIMLIDGETTTSNFAPSPGISGDGWRIVLSWGEDPSDLDSHLWVPISGGGYDEVYFSAKGDCAASPYACLDVDDTSSYGPETITITEVASGTYAYALHWYTGTGTWDGSEAVVRVYNSSGLVREFTAPDDVGDPYDGKRWWYIFDFDNGNITVHNTIQADPPLPSAVGSSLSVK